jgi:hypothetical protein
MDNAMAPAFPVSEEETDRILDNVHIFSGLTKREYFAGLAMQALIPTGSEGYHQEVVGRRARLAVHQADALLKALEKGQ